MNIIKGIILLIFSFFIFNCVATKPPLPKIEYNGNNLSWNAEDYKIEQMTNISETFFMIIAPANENILLNIYKDDGTLVGTLFAGKGGVIITSLALYFYDYDYELIPGDYVLILYGEKGKTLFKLKAV
jgi:hypothetical protein